MAARAISDETRARILELNTQGLGCNRIGKEVGVSGNTVSRVCKAAGLTFNRSATRAAVAAHHIDATASRQKLKLDLLADAHRLRAQLWEPAELINFGGKDNTMNSTTLKQPLFVDKKNLMTSVGIAVEKFARLDALDADGGVTDTLSMIHQLIQGVGIPDE